MRKSGLGSLSMAISLVGLGCLVGGPSFAVDGPITFYLNGTGASPVLAGVYTSPYYGGITPNALLPVICDDFGDNSYIPENWQVWETTLTEINQENSPSALLKWNTAKSNGSVNGQSWNLTSQKDAYNAAAELAIEILDTHFSVLQREQLSFALWELFDARDGAAALNQNWGNPAHVHDNVATQLTGDSADLNAATAYVMDAIQKVTAQNFGGFSGAITFYSYDSAGRPVPQCGLNACSDIPPQEFIGVTEGSHIVRVAEASFFDSLGLYVLGGGLALLFFGRRTFRKAGRTA